MSTLVVCSGGLDSVTLAWKVHKESKLELLVSFDYGQRHVKELDCAASCATELGVAHEIIDLRGVGQCLSGSSLTDDIPVPDGHYAASNMAATVVPNRNAIMLTIAFGIAAAHQYDRVAAAVHGGDHFIYPDCRPKFVDAFNLMQTSALEGIGDILTYTPFLNLSKSDIVKEGNLLGVPFAKTWSCYKGGDTHCGRCGTCVERQEAFALSRVVDPTTYEDSDFWQTTTR